MTVDLLFYAGLALLFTHELDAVKRHEWRIFPFVCNRKDDVAYYLFIVLHVPLFMLLLWLSDHPSGSVRYWFQISMDVFFMVHLGLHKLLESHDKYEFLNPFSRALIILIAIVSLFHFCFLVWLNTA